MKKAKANGFLGRTGLLAIAISMLWSPTTSRARGREEVRDNILMFFCMSSFFGGLALAIITLPV
jgi:hypothetical protein